MHEGLDLFVKRRDPVETGFRMSFADSSPTAIRAAASTAVSVHRSGAVTVYFP
jgi:hypothetical protein